MRAVTTRYLDNATAPARAAARSAAGLGRLGAPRLGRVRSSPIPADTKAPADATRVLFSSA